MARSQRLRDDDVRAAIRLVREVCELGDDMQSWRIHLLTELRRLIGAGICVNYFHRLPMDSSDFRPKLYLDVEAPPEWHAYIGNADLDDNPMTPGMMQLVGRSEVRSEDQLCTRNQWYSSVHFNQVCRPLRTNHQLASLTPLPSGRIFSCLGFGRFLGDPAFGARERTLVHLVHTELALLWKEPAPANGSALPRRLGETLALIQRGLSEKQIAVQLGLSRHTVHDYVKQLHRRFNVCTTAELVANTRERREFRPVLRWN